MEVLSVNLNKCGGIRSNGKGELYDTVIAGNMANVFKDFLNLGDSNVVFVNETNNAIDNLKKFESLFDEEIYTIHKPTNFEEFNKNSHPYGCTIAITKNNRGWEKINSIDLKDCKSGELSYANKSVILRNGDVILVGIHIPYDMGYWNEVINYFSANFEKRIYLVGDFNVYDEGTDRKLKFDELKRRGAIDVWLNKGNDNSHVTCTTGRRLDYLMTSAIGYTTIKKMSYVDSLRLNGLTDHSGVFFELER